MAAAPAIRMVSRMILKPDDRPASRGTWANTRLKAMEARMTPVRILLVLAGGITTARNIPYSATFRALKKACRKQFPGNSSQQGAEGPAGYGDTDEPIAVKGT